MEGEHKRYSYGYGQIGTSCVYEDGGDKQP
jgi:hypothetical protein